jgi:hypothetical protein
LGTCYHPLENERKNSKKSGVFEKDYENAECFLMITKKCKMIPLRAQFGPDGWVEV